MLRPALDVRATRNKAIGSASETLPAYAMNLNAQKALMPVNALPTVN